MNLKTKNDWWMLLSIALSVQIARYLMKNHEQVGLKEAFFIVVLLHLGVWSIRETIKARSTPKQAKAKARSTPKQAKASDDEWSMVRDSEIKDTKQ